MDSTASDSGRRAAQRRKSLSKLMSLILWHEPEKFGLRLEDDGSVEIAALLAAITAQLGWRNVTEAELREVVAASDKQRFEMAGSTIRARYGHSTPAAIQYEPVEPPPILYHGTSPASLAAIRAEGLRPMNRQYVHLSTSVERAREVGKRHCSRPIILTVRSGAAWESGVVFFQPEN